MALSYYVMVMLTSDIVCLVFYCHFLHILLLYILSVKTLFLFVSFAVWPWLLTEVFCISLVFHRKDLCKLTPKMQSVFKFSDVLFALSQMDHPVYEGLGQVDIFVRSLGQADLCSDIPPRIRLPVRLTFLSDVWVMLTFGQMYSQGLGLQSDWNFCQTFRSGWLVVRCTPQIRFWVRLTFLSDLWVRMIFGQMYPTTVDTSHGQVCYYFG